MGWFSRKTWRTSKSFQLISDPPKRHKISTPTSDDVKRMEMLILPRELWEKRNVKAFSLFVQPITLSPSAGTSWEFYIKDESCCDEALFLQLRFPVIKLVFKWLSSNIAIFRHFSVFVHPILSDYWVLSVIICRILSRLIKDNSNLTQIIWFRVFEAVKRYQKENLSQGWSSWLLGQRGGEALLMFIQTSSWSILLMSPYDSRAVHLLYL